MISGFTMVRNAIDGDFPIEECVRSLLACCDEVLVGYAESTDTTRDLLDDLETRLDRVRVVDAPCDFSVRSGGARWMIDWMDRTRKQIRGSYQIHLDADEVLADWSIPELKEAEKNGRSLYCKRLNFWGRIDRICPHGHWCGSETVRCAPSRFQLVSDFPVVVPVYSHAGPSNVQIFHYATLRKPECFVKKSEAIQTAMNGSCDQSIYEAMKSEGHWTDYFKFKEPFIDYRGKHPEVIKPWLRARNHHI